MLKNVHITHRGDLIDVFKIVKGYDDICENIVLLDQNPV